MVKSFFRAGEQVRPARGVLVSTNIIILQRYATPRSNIPLPSGGSIINRMRQSLVLVMSGKLRDSRHGALDIWLLFSSSRSISQSFNGLENCSLHLDIAAVLVTCLIGIVSCVLLGTCFPS